MFKDTKAFSGFSVDDLERAKAFYGGTLGMAVDDEGGMLKLHLAGGNDVLVYPKPNHVPATYTILNFPVDDVAETVEALKGKGVQFERYDEGDLKTDERGIHQGGDGGPTIAWFKDPAGNYLAVLEASGPH
jgi:catechol 2,3-dioxygenase-like lactoylglutathione lyase family enzyme